MYNVGQTYPHADKLFVQYDPGQQVGARHVRGEQRYGVGGQQRTQRYRVQVRGYLPQQTKHHAAIYEAACGCTEFMAFAVQHTFTHSGPRPFSALQLTGSKSAVTQTTHHIAHNLGGTVALLQRQPAQHVDGKEQDDKVRAEPGRKERRIEFDDGGGLADVDGKLGGVVLQIGHDGGLRVAGAPQVEQLEAVRSAHPGGGHQERDADAKVHLERRGNIAM